MKSLLQVRHYLQPFINTPPDISHNDFFIKVKELTKGPLQHLIDINQDGSIYVKDLDTTIAYDYVGDTLLGVHITHLYLESHDAISSLNTSITLPHVIRYLQQYVNQDIHKQCINVNCDYEEFVELLSVSEPSCYYLVDLLLDLSRIEDINVKKVEDTYILEDFTDRLQQYTFYLLDLNVFLTITGFYNSWDGTDWEGATCYISRPVTKLVTEYIPVDIKDTEINRVSS